MSQAQTAAVLVAGQLAAGRPPVGAAGLQVTSAHGAGLNPGDIILAAGDTAALTPLRAENDLEAAAARLSSLLLLVVPKTSGSAWGKAVLRKAPSADVASVRVVPTESATAYSLAGVAGPSGGLILALARIDALTSGALTAGRRVAGTGAISLDGSVTDVSEVAEKVRAAEAAGVDVFFVPVLQRAVAIRAAHGKMRVVPVASVTEAVRWLCATGGRGPIC